MNLYIEMRRVLTILSLTTSLLISSYASAANSISAEKMSQAAQAFLDSLTENQKQSAVLSLNSRKYLEWRFFPEPTHIASLVLPERKGVGINSLNSDQTEALRLLLKEGVSEKGLDALDAAIELDKDSSVELRGRLNLFLFDYGPENYFVTFFGKPSDKKWAWRLEGHHISINFTIENGEIVSSLPVFIGTTIKSIQVGDKSIEPLKDVAELAQQLATSLQPEQLRMAGQAIKKVPLFNPVAPGILGGKTRIPSEKYKGLSSSTMTDEQKTTIVNLLEAYQSHFTAEISGQNMISISRQDIKDIELIWTGDVTMKKPFYFRILGPHFILEFNTSEGHADHFHTAWVTR
tara:strand:+ start:32547 stop:33590 length:1044 start_codon:yes stop_codon:yes gene_type:complete